MATGETGGFRSLPQSRSKAGSFMQSPCMINLQVHALAKTSRVGLGMTISGDLELQQERVRALGLL